MLCESCDEEATILVERRIQITRLSTDENPEEILAVHPNEPYEQEMMTDWLCEKCAREEGYLDGVEENDQ